MILKFWKSGSKSDRERRACVFAASREGATPQHVQDAVDVGHLLAKHGWQVIYGGGPAGLMGVFARSFLRSGKPLWGIVPEHLATREREHVIDGVIIEATPTIYQRKQRMIEDTDMFVVLPGGIGTLDELFEVIEMKYHGETNARIVLYSTDGFWDPIYALVDHLLALGYVTPKHRLLVDRVSEVAALEAIVIETQKVLNPPDGSIS